MNEDNQNDKFDKNYQGISPNNFSFFSFPLINSNFLILLQEKLNLIRRSFFK